MLIKIINQQKNYTIISKTVIAFADFVIQNELKIFEKKNKIDISKNVKHSEFLIYIIDDKKIIELNNKIFNKNNPTDVISFGYFENFDPFLKVIAEIFISIDQAFVQSKKFQTNLNSEFLLYVVHGILHSFGYDDIDSKKRRLMRIREKYYMNFIKAYL